MAEEHDSNIGTIRAEETRAPSLLNLPREIRDMIYEGLLVAHQENEITFGKGSGISISILSTCRQIHQEACSLIASNRHTLVYDPQSGPALWDSISPSHLRLLKRIKLIIRYHTANRGDCEIEVLPICALFSFTEAFGLTLRHSSGLEELFIELQNKEQRKRGPKRLRSELVSQQVQDMLRPFAYLHTRVKVSVGGFDTIDFVDMFEQMRCACAGKEVPFRNLLYASLVSGTNRFGRHM